MELLITGAYKLEDYEKDKFEKLGYTVTFVKDERKQLEIDVSKFEAVICNSLFQFNDIEDFKNLKYIQVTSAGLDRLPLDFINQKNIKVSNARGVYSIPMAEWTILKILEIYKKSHFFHETQKNKIWTKNRNVNELNKSIVSIVGYGSVGQAISKRLKGFSTHTIAIDIKQNILDHDINEYFHINELIKAIKKSDIVIITLPLTEKTKYLFDYELMSLMKNTSVLINLSRGQLIKEKDLIKLLNEKKFMGCALDVFEEEPLNIESELWDFDRVYITPHNSFISNENKDRLSNLVMENLVRFKNGSVNKKMKIQ